jgi:glycine betaine/proline transport system ATP-binding protein
VDILMLAMHKSETTPVALCNDDGTFAGAIGVKDVLRAVLKRAE